MSVPKSNFTYSIESHNGKKFIAITDQDLGGRSVTNDIENVVEKICQDEKISGQEHLIIYQDSDGIWDGWDYITESFIALQVKHKPDAITKFLSRLS